NHDCFDRPAGGSDMIRQRLTIEGLASQRNKHDAADVWMRRQRPHHARGIFIWITAGKADQMNVRVVTAIDDPARNVVSTFHEVGDRDHIANAFATVAAQVSVETHVY